MIGVLRTRALPNSSTKPSVTLKTPPYSAMSCPSSTTRSSRRITVRSPSLIASTYRSSGACASSSGEGPFGTSRLGAKTSASFSSTVERGSGASSASSARASIRAL